MDKNQRQRQMYTRAHCTSTRKRKTAAALKPSTVAARIASSWGRTTDYAVPMNPASYRQRRDNLVLNGNDILVANKGARLALL